MRLVGDQNAVFHAVQDDGETFVLRSHRLQELFHLFCVELGELFQGTTDKSPHRYLPAISRMERERLSTTESGFMFRVLRRSQ